MGIEPTWAALKSLQNTAFRDSEKPACDWRANFRVMRDNAGLRETTPPFAIEFPLSGPIPGIHECPLFGIGNSYAPSRAGNLVGYARLFVLATALHTRAAGDQLRP